MRCPTETVHLNYQQAQDKARLACLRQLFRDFPDAQLLSQQQEVAKSENGVTVTVILQVEANIASAGQV